LQGFARKSSEVLSVSSKLRSGRPQFAIFSLISIFRFFEPVDAVLVSRDD
jgi:hypothetical protein